MSVHDDAPYLAQAIESVLGQTFADFEFLILDDGSTDGSGGIIAAYAARDPRIRAFAQENRGLIASLNRLIGEARAPLIARMDGDDVSLPTRFERQLAFLAAHPDHGVVGTWATCIDEAGATRGNCGEKPVTHEALLEQLREGPLFCHPSVIMRRDLLARVGGYHPAYRHCEDHDVWLRLAGLTRFANLPERLILYRHSESQVSTRHFVQQKINTAIAYQALLERQAGRPDPTSGLDELPGLDRVDALFGRPGLGREIRAQVVEDILYSPTALRSDGYELLLDHLAAGGSGQGLWRTAGRLARLGEPKRALKLAAALVTRKAA